MKPTLEELLKQIESLKKEHYYCEDTWYSCPKHPMGCANDTVGEECDCGTDEYNTKVDTIIKALLDREEYRG